MLDDQQVMGASLSQVLRVGMLGVQSVGCDDRIGDLDLVQQRGEQGNFVGLGAYLDLPQHHAMGMVERGEQVPAVVAAVPGAA